MSLQHSLMLASRFQCFGKFLRWCLLFPSNFQHFLAQFDDLVMLIHGKMGTRLFIVDFDVGRAVRSIGFVITL